MKLFTQCTLVIGRSGPQGIQMLGSGFICSNQGDEIKIATTKHVIEGDDRNLVILMPSIRDINEYQDTSDNRCTPFPVTISEIDTFRDIAILSTNLSYGETLPQISSFEDINVGDELTIYGFPHCVEGRRVLTQQIAHLGAKIYLQSGLFKVKHGVINTQSRPGQSGSMIYSHTKNKVVGMLIGAFATSNRDGISLGGINPRELHQTTHCISAEYINNML